ncbi:MAG: radical SAM protein [Bacteroidales bacterium]|nr:radical SAM protein [Bacteroidales bacterium]
MPKNLKKLNKIPYLLVADEKGNIFEDIELRLVVREGRKLRLPELDEFIELPYGSDIFFLPKHKAIGFNEKTKSIEFSNKGYAVAAFVAPAHTQLALAAWKKQADAPVLPLYAYTAIGWYNNKFYTTAQRIDPDIRQDCKYFNQKKVVENTKIFLKKYARNRLVKHLVYCATVYYCPAARNYFLNRYEAPLPTSPTCNSKCRGCISYQPKTSGFKATQNRITFTPTPEEIAQVAIDHLNSAPNPIVSFGQGCEGEPLLVADIIAESIKIIRKHTKAGIINLNTNGSLPNKIEELIKAGLDSVRISINSFIKENYDKYFKPVNYCFDDVIESIKIIRKHKKWCSINYFVLPGYTNSKEEIAALEENIIKLKFNMIQWRNFNIDPDFYDSEITMELTKPDMTTKHLLQYINAKYPFLYHGYFNPHKEIIDKYNF